MCWTDGEVQKAASAKRNQSVNEASGAHTGPHIFFLFSFFGSGFSLCFYCAITTTRLFLLCFAVFVVVFTVLVLRFYFAFADVLLCF